MVPRLLLDALCCAVAVAAPEKVSYTRRPLAGPCRQSLAGPYRQSLAGPCRQSLAGQGRPFPRKGPLVVRRNSVSVDTDLNTPEPPQRFLRKEQILGQKTVSQGNGDVNNHLLGFTITCWAMSTTACWAMSTTTCWAMSTTTCWASF